MLMSSSLFVALLVGVAGAASGQLAVPRPSQDCIIPGQGQVTTFDFYPEAFQIRTIRPVATRDNLGTKVR
jgi:hypothetical protein